MILETLHELDMKINHLTSVVQSLAGRSNVPMLVVDSEDDVFPLTSMEDLDNLERQLSERGMMQKMVRITDIFRFNNCNEKIVSSILFVLFVMF